MTQAEDATTRPDDSPPLHRSWWGVLIKFILAAGVLVAVYLIWQTWISPHEADIERSLERLGPWGPVIFIVAFLIGTSLFFPESVLAIAAGTIFGLWWGLLWVVVAGTLTAVVVYWLGRTALRNRIEPMLARHPRLDAVDEAASGSGLKLILLLRLSPMNFTMLCWLLSISRVRFRTYLLSCVGMFPGNFSTVYLGFAARHTADLANRLKAGDGRPPGDSMVHEITLYSGLVVSLVVSLLVARIAVRAMKTATGPSTADTVSDPSA